jgi:hypothetical protein
MLKEYLDFERDAALLAEVEEVAKCYSASCVFADVQYRIGVMHSAIKAYCSPNLPIELVLNVLLAKAPLLLRRGLFEGTNRVMDNFGTQNVQDFANESSERRPALCCHQIAIAKRVGRPDLDKRGSGQSDLRFTSEQTGDAFAFDHLRDGDEDLDPVADRGDRLAIAMELADDLLHPREGPDVFRSAATGDIDSVVICSIDGVE